MAKIECIRCGNEREQASDVLYGGKLGDTIRSSVCYVCWAEWQDTEVKIINEYRLDLSDPNHRSFMTQKMKEFLGLLKAG
ncbi:MAG: Fe(2+)-trafficking protein [Thaumarchaeota archaeon]|nr:Fe(2+)-trafficking protein [Nitrososphaerota archaeon]